MQLGPYNFAGNSFQHFKVALAQHPDNLLPKDWSFVAWGDKGPAYVYSADGTQT